MLLRTLLLLSALLSVGAHGLKLLHEFVKVEYRFPNDTMRDEYIASGKFDYKACQISNIAVDDGKKIFVTVPKISAAKGIPAGLNTIRYDMRTKSSYLEPYPNWEWNEQGNCDVLQFPMAITFDPNTSYLWIIDDGLVGIWSGEPQVKCPAKIVAYDTWNHMRVFSYDFPEDVVSKSNNFLNDLVLDYVNPHEKSVRYVYISDSVNEGIVVFDVVNRDSWIVKDDTMKMVNPNITVNGKSYNMKVGINGIALSPSFNFVYFGVLTDRSLYQVPTWALREKGTDISSLVRKVGQLDSNPDGMVFSKRYLYYGGMTTDALYRWAFRSDMQSQRKPEYRVNLESETMVAQNWDTMQWIDDIDVAPSNDIYFTAERAQKFHAGQIDWTGKEGSNFRIFKLEATDPSYLDIKAEDEIF